MAAPGMHTLSRRQRRRRNDCVWKGCWKLESPHPTGQAGPWQQWEGCRAGPTVLPLLDRFNIDPWLAASSWPMTSCLCLALCSCASGKRTPERSVLCMPNEPGRPRRSSSGGSAGCFVLCYSCCSGGDLAFAQLGRCICNPIIAQPSGA